jgi:sterol carrier protein 2
MARRASLDVYKKTGIKPDQIDVVELHDCFSTNELILYEILGLCPPGKGGEAVDKGVFDYGGRCVVCPSGGLLSKGHPIGASGLAQCAELCWQLRGMAEKRQVKDAKIAL